MSLLDEQQLFTFDVANLIFMIKDYAKDHDIKISLGEVYRTEYQQAEYLRTGLSKTKNSQHLKKLAIDINFIKDGKLINCPVDIGEYWESLSPKNHWGGHWKTFKDYGHFERTA